MRICTRECGVREPLGGVPPFPLSTSFPASFIACGSEEFHVYEAEFLPATPSPAARRLTLSPLCMDAIRDDGSSDAVAQLCPLTLEPLRFPVTLRGGRFEADALVAMLISDPRRIHPYERTSLTSEEVLLVLDTAMRDDTARLRLSRLGCEVLGGGFRGGEGGRPSGSASTAAAGFTLRAWPVGEQHTWTTESQILLQIVRELERRQEEHAETTRRVVLLLGLTLAAIHLYL